MTGAPQDGHADVRAIPHSPQNFPVSGFCAPQDPQVTASADLLGRSGGNDIRGPQPTNPESGVRVANRNSIAHPPAWQAAAITGGGPRHRAAPGAAGAVSATVHDGLSTGGSGAAVATGAIEVLAERAPA